MRGYLAQWLPEHPLGIGRRYVYVHRVVLYDKIGPGAHPCHWCDKSVFWDRQWPRDEDALVVDHVDRDVANNDPSNLVPSCGPCNAMRDRERDQESGRFV